MNDVSKLPGTCTVCGQRAPIVADMEAQVSFRTLPNHAFLVWLKMCRECCKLLGMSEESAREAIGTQKYPGSEPVAEMPKCPCGNQAQLMTSSGYRCRVCIGLRKGPLT